jgi:hypothetical protein
VPKPVSHDLENRSLAAKAAEVKAAFLIEGLPELVAQVERGCIK